MNRHLSDFFADVPGLLAWLVVAMVVLGAGCSSQHYRKSADKEAYRAIQDKVPRVPNMDSNFTIETNALVLWEDLPKITEVDPALGEIGSSEVGTHVLSLAKALEIAVKNSRDYQNSKENLYLSALSLTLARYQYTPIFSAGANPRYSGNLTKNVDTFTDTHQMQANPNAGVKMLLNSGMKLATAFTVDFFRFIKGGDPRLMAGSTVAGTLSQPLLRGAGYKVNLENLTQAERNLLYDMRTFVQFRKSFTVDVVSQFYNVLRSKEQARNEWNRAKSFRQTAERTRAMYGEGLAKRADVGRLEQEEISTDISLTDALVSYQRNLDNFKITLGISLDAPIVLDDGELKKLRIDHPDFNTTNAVRVALASRLDLYSVRDQFEDAARKIDLAKNQLLPDLTLVLDASASAPRGRGLPELDLQNANWSAGFDVNLPLDRKSERNSYRASLINYERARRKLELAVDQIKLAVNDNWRSLETAKRNYDSSVIGVRVNQERVDEQNLLAEYGRATTIDQVDAQNALTASLNAQTSALVNHTITRLKFWRDLGILTIKDNGLWEEANNISTP
jgi:outer membrane protein TolC